MVEIVLAPGDLLYDYNASGEVQLSRAFEDYPTLTGVTLNIPRGQLTTAKAALIKGNLVSALGMFWIISSLSWQKQHRYQDTYAVSLDLQAPLAPRDSEIVSRRQDLDIPTDISGMLDKGVLNLKTLVFYQGNDYKIPFGIPDDELRVTPRELLEQYKRRLHSQGGFLYWGGLVPEARAWGRQAVHEIPKILNETMDVEEPGQGAVVDGVQLTTEAVNLEFVPDDSVEYKYDEYQRIITDVPNGADRASRHLLNIDVANLFKGAGDWFDSGGVVKEKVTEELVNGKHLTKRIERWGFFGSSIGGSGTSTLLPLQYRRSHRIQRDVLQNDEGEDEVVYNKIHQPTPSILLETFWRKFYDVTEHYRWDGDQYLAETWSNGWQAFRFKQESDSLEASETFIKEYQAQDALDEHLATTMGETVEEIAAWNEKKAELTKAVNDARDIGARQRVAYSRFDVIFYDRSNSYSRYGLDFLSNYYRDVRFTPKNPSRFCNLETQVRDWARTMVDPDFDPRVTPDNAEDGVPMLVVGERYSMERRVRINTPASRADQRTTQNFQESKKESNAEGNSFKDRLVLHPVTQNDGRPSEHERREFYGWTKNQLEATLGFSIDRIENQKTLLLNTPNTGYGASDPPLGEWSSPGVRLNSEARPAMATEFSIANTQNAKTTTLTIPADLAIEEGDTLKYGGEFWIAFGLDLTFKIERGVARCENMEASVGRVIAFDDLWQVLYPTAGDYPPGLVYPGVGNPPAIVETTISYLGVVNRDVMQLFVSPLNTEVFAPLIIAPAPIPLGTNPVPTAELNIQPVAAAPIPLGTNEVTTESLYLQNPQILRKDIGWGPHGFASSPFWSSFSRGLESDIGSLDYGYFQRGTSQFLWVLLGGGGATNGDQKFIEIRRREDDSLAFATTLVAVMNVNLTYAQQWAALPLVTLAADELFYVRFIDNDTGSSWAWIKVDLGSFIFED